MVILGSFYQVVSHMNISPLTRTVTVASLLVSGFGVQAIAQTAPGIEAETLVDQKIEKVSTNVDDLRIRPNFRLRYDSYDASVGPGLYGFKAFVPLSQTIGKNITYLESGYSFDTEGGGLFDITTGYRFMNSDRLYGAYLGSKYRTKVE